MVHVRERLEKTESNEIVAVLGNLEANVGIFGGRYYTYNCEYLGQKVTGQLAFKEIIAIAEKHIKESQDRITYPDGLYSRIMNLYRQGEDKLAIASIIQRILTSIRRFFGNWNFDKLKIVEDYSFGQGYEQCRRDYPQPQTSSSVPQTVHATSPLKSKR